MDDVPETITIMTDQFSSYVIAYRALGATGAETAKGRTACGLCHICPTFLGICCYVWLAAGVLIIGLLAAVVIVALLRRGREGRTQVHKTA